MRAMIGATLVAGTMTSGAMAQDCAGITDDAARLECFDASTSAQCQIEDFRYYEHMAGTLGIEGVATCAEGRLNFQLYDGENFLAADDTFIRGFGFKTFVDLAVMPSDMTIRYVIDTD